MMTDKEKRKWQREGLEDMESRLSILANSRFNNFNNTHNRDGDKQMWNLLLRFRDKLRQQIEKKYL